MRAGDPPTFFKHEILNEDMDAILFAILSTAVLLLCLRRRRDADGSREQKETKGSKQANASLPSLPSVKMKGGAAR